MIKFINKPGTSLLLKIFLTAAILFFLLPNADAREKPYPERLRLGLVSGINPVRLIKQWEPLARALSDSSGLPVEIVLRENYDDLFHAMKAGEIDIIEGGAYLFTRLSDELGAKILLTGVRSEIPTYNSIIVVRKDSGINNLRDLKNRTMTFTDPYSTSGYLYPRIMLAESGITDPGKYLSVQSPQSSRGFDSY